MRGVSDQTRRLSDLPDQIALPPPVCDDSRSSLSRRDRGGRLSLPRSHSGHGHVARRVNLHRSTSSASRLGVSRTNGRTRVGARESGHRGSTETGVTVGHGRVSETLVSTEKLQQHRESASDSGIILRNFFDSPCTCWDPRSNSSFRTKT